MKSVANQLIVAIITTAVTFFLLLSNGVQAQVEGTPCTDDTPCDTASTFLKCDVAAGVCRCPNPTTEYFETESNTCRKIATEECDPDVVELECPLHGWCDTTIDPPYHCQCMPPYLETVSKRCAIPQGEECTSNSDCNYGGFVQCLPGTPQTCGCDPATSKYDPDTEQCFFTPNAECLDPTDTVPHQLCAPGSECTNEGDGLKCHCFAGSSDNGLGECWANQGEVCNADVRCNDAKYLDCVIGVCGCDPAKHKLDDGNGGCTGDFEADCNDGSFCNGKPFLDCINGKCDCKDDLEIAGGVCTSKFGGSCAAGEPCHTDKWVDCVFGICTCDGAKHMIPDGKGDGCTGDFEAPCDQSQPCDDRIFLECIGNDRCDCRSDLVNIDGVCTSNFGGSCTAGEPCNADKWLKCIENICTCDADDHMFDDGNGNCIGQINAPCNQGQPCDPRQLLVCLTPEGKCGCEVGTIFDPVTQKCVRNDGDVRPGDPCQGDGDCKSDTSFMECDLEAVPFSQCQCQGNETAYFESADAKCHKFAHEICDESGGMACPLNGGCDPFEVPATCKCFETHDFHETSTKKCAKPHGATCADSTECDRDSFVRCGGAEDGKCGCDMDAWFNPTTKTCLLLADSSCNPDHNVTEKPQACAPNSFCSFIDQRCHCEDGLYQNDQRLCFLKAGEPCNPLDDDDLCDVTQFHSCDPVDAKCTCAREETVVEEFAGMCRIRANAECSLNLGAQECTTHSTCVPGDSSHFCECDAGLVPSKVGKCVLTYGLPCGGDIRGTCDSEGFQSCQEGRCTCLNEDQMEYEPAVEKCSLKLSSPCVPGGVIACKEHSHCDPAIQKCQCNQGWIEDGQGNCVGQGQFWSLTKMMGRAR